MDDLTRDAVARGMLLQAAEFGLSDIAATAMLQGAAFGEINKAAVRRHMEYLAGDGKSYISINKTNPNLWQISLRPKGKDLIDGRIPDDAGIQIAKMI